ncbi:DMT family transporter [Sabulicella glaciei]|uniref:DMT family transporter n=1 Tax=Sabulicella glaciei TaxID=2984948 RepID=A0ABT3NTY7_9PROT|nr:DMT family transporter [Roseococcus sp. MDT2-1-1]MCW8085609.1 DMT family transporter [Roseococcus sp. MDT2-1-1]
MCTAGLLFPMMSGFAKLLGEDYSSLQVSWARAFVHLLFLSALFLPHSGLGVLRSRRPVLQLARAAMLTTSNLATFYALTFIALAEQAAIQLAAPLIVALLAWPVLRERTTVASFTAVAIGFVGVLVLLRPGSGVFQWPALWVLLSAVAYGVYQILTRLVAPHDPPATSALWSPLVGAFGLMLVLPFVWRTPATLPDLLLFLGCGAFGAIGHYFVARAMVYAPANIIAPFQYFQLLGSVVIGWLLFSHLPDAATWVGAAIIVASGLFLGWSQRRTR